MYAIYGNIYHQYTPNDSIHGSYGIVNGVYKPTNITGGPHIFLVRAKRRVAGWVAGGCWDDDYW